MAKQCISCNKNIGLLTVRIPLLDDESIVICDECFQKMPPIINEIYLKRIHPDKQELTLTKENVLTELRALNYNIDTLNVVAKFFDNKIERAHTTNSDDNALIQKVCPICSKKSSYECEVCSNCGYIFTTNEVMYTENDIAEIYNHKAEQVKSNPFYEYDYVVIPNNSDGSVNKEQISKVINEHSRQGWRVVTMYSNEIGKNAIAGINATACEDIILFERCIKFCR